MCLAALLLDLTGQPVNRILILAWHNIEVESAPVTASMRFNWPDGAWLTVALLLHVSLLFIPLRQHSADRVRSSTLTLSLMPPPRLEIENEHIADPAPPPGKSKPETDESRLSEMPPTAIAQPEPSTADKETSSVSITTAHLVDAASRTKWPVPATENLRQLGVHQARETPDNWRSGIRLDENLFDGMTVPARTEIVDQWLDADGSFRVVINTPAGETLCGRKQAWDPMRPMVEHLVMFTTCGGGGKRTFKMPDRFNRHLVD
jgi:hypothetical protein